MDLLNPNCLISLHKKTFLFFLLLYKKKRINLTANIELRI